MARIKRSRKKQSTDPEICDVSGMAWDDCPCPRHAMGRGVSMPREMSDRRRNGRVPGFVSQEVSEALGLDRYTGD